MAQKLPLGVQTFEEIIRHGYVYVDKTTLIHQLANGGKYFFLSRPRRFGKSLLLSTLEAYFTGRRDLFHGLAMEQLETEWESYPVLRLDLNSGNYTGGVEELNDRIAKFLDTYERAYNLPQEGMSFGTRFGCLIQNIYDKTGKQVVFLVDEYDKPLIANVEKEMEALQAQQREILKAFYGNVKTMDPCIRFAMFTGVSRFSHVSVFSDLNNLTDISLDDRFSAICGITEQELHHYLDEDVAELAARCKITKAEAYESLKHYYDGFRFSDEGVELYNPWSLFKALTMQRFGTYWYQSGTPSFLIKMIRDGQLDLTKMDGNIITNEETMMTFESDTNVVAPLYQTGYLTIKDCIIRPRRFPVYKLGFPNLEVETAFSSHLLPVYTSIRTDQVFPLANAINEAAQAGDVDTLLTTVRGILAEAPVESNDERVIELNYRNLIAIALRMSGLDCHIEQATSAGRIDLALEADDFVYVMEFKRTSLDDAARQIETRHYADRYLNDPRTVIKVAVALDDTVRNIASWQVFA